MAISFKYRKKKWGQVHYLIDDKDREPYALVGILRLPGKRTKFLLAHIDGSEALYHDFLVTIDVNFPKPLPPIDDIDEDESNDDEDE